VKALVALVAALVAVAIPTPYDASSASCAGPMLL
jgi:hypothetical protein